jgi:mitogen-activated protein kinase organizer 1
MLWNPACEHGDVAGPEALSTSGDDAPRLLRKPITSFAGHSHEVFGVAIAGDNSRFVSCGGDKLVIVWDVATARAARKLSGHTHRVNAVALNADASVAFSAGYDTSVRCWDLRSHMREPIQTLDQAADSVSSISVHGHKIVSGSVDGCVRVYDLRMGELTTHMIGPPVSSAVVSRDGNCVLACTLDDRSRLIDLGSGELLASYGGSGLQVEREAQGRVRTFACRSYKVEAALSSDDAFVIAGSEEGGVHTWDLVSEESQGVLAGHTAAVCSTACHPDIAQCMLLTGSHDGTARFWVP